jgi:hypothetical protein
MNISDNIFANAGTCAGDSGSNFKPMRATHRLGALI